MKVAEPAPKRKTLTERAGMTTKPHQGPPTSTRNGMSATSRGNATLPRKMPSSALASASAQTPSTASRAQPNGSLSACVGIGSRPQTTPSSSRPASAMGNYNAPSDSSVPAARPASVLGTNPAANGRQGLGKRKGTISISLFEHLHADPASGLDDQLLMEGDESHDPHGTTRSSSPSGLTRPLFTPRSRDVSLSTAMRNLHITADSCIGADNQGSLTCSTPSLIPKPRIASKPVSPITFSPSKVVKRSASPVKLPFLTRDSRTKAWDTKGRLEDVELFCSDLQERLNGTTRERNGLEETASQYKSRSMSSPAASTCAHSLLFQDFGVIAADLLTDDPDT